MFIPIWLIVIFTVLWLIAGYSALKMREYLDSREEFHRQERYKLISEWATEKTDKETYREQLTKVQQQKTARGYCTFCWKCNQEKR